MSRELSTLPSLSVVIPVYRAAGRLDRLVERLLQALDSLCIPYEILLVDDDSPDQTWPELLVVRERRADLIRLLRLSRNAGQHAALLCGIRAAQGAIIVTMDDDLQHPPEEIGKLLAALSDGVDLVYGAPVAAEHSWARNAASRLTKWVMQSVFQVGHAADIGAFRAFRTELRDSFSQFSGPAPCLDVLLSWGTNRIAAAPVQHCAREHGKSNYTFAKLVRHAWVMITGFSDLPLRAILVVGLVTILAALLLPAIAFLWSPQVAGAGIARAWLAGAFALTTGFQLTALGLVATYFCKVQARSAGQPSYVIRKSVEASGSPGAANFATVEGDSRDGMGNVSQAA